MLVRTVRRRGAALVFAISMLFALAVLAIGFARMMGPERDGARAHGLATQARLASHAGIEVALARLRADAAAGRIDDVYGDWRYMGEDASRDFVADPEEDTNLNGLVEREECPLVEATAPSYQVSGKPYSGILDHPGLPAGWTIRYRLRVVDGQSMLNLNERKADWYLYDHLGIGIRKHLGMARDLIQEIEWPDPAGGANLRGGRALLEYRDTLPDKVFTDRRQLIPVLANGEHDLRILAPYVTVHSWQDPQTYRPSADPWWQPANLVAEPTHPIHINTATAPVLNAAISGEATWFFDRSTQGDYRKRQAGAFYYGYANHDGWRFQARANAGYDPWRWRQFGWAWYWETYEEGFETWTPPIHKRRIGREVDLDGSGAAEPAEETSFANGVLDTGPFRSSQDWSNFVVRYNGPDDVWWESMRGGLLPQGMVNRYNPDHFPSLGFHQAGGVRQFNASTYGYGDRTNFYRHGPAWCFRSLGYFEIESLGEVVDADGLVVASHRTQVDARVFYPLVHSTQKDFLSHPEAGKSWRTGQEYPAVGWTAKMVRDQMSNTTTFPENVKDNADGSSDADASKAEPYFGGVQLAPPGVEPTAGLTFAADFESSFDAEVAAGGAASARPTFGRNVGSKRVQEDRAISRTDLAGSSDLFVDGLHVDPHRGRHCTYANPDFANMRPDEGMVEFWLKFNTLHYPGEILTAFFPADPTVEAASSEGIVFRIYLASMPSVTNDFTWFRPAFLPRAGDDVPKRHYNWYFSDRDDVMKVPVLVAERSFYTAAIDMETGKIHGRDATFGGAATTATYANGKYAIDAAHFVAYEYYPLTNWGKDKMWHRVNVSWRDGTDVHLEVDGVPSAFRWTVPSGSAAQGDVYTTWWDREDLVPEIHVGGTRLRERWKGTRAYAPGYSTAGGPQTIRWPQPEVYAGSYGNPWRWMTSATIDQLRVWSDPEATPTRDRYRTPATYQNVFQLPDDATRLASIAWDQLVPMFDPNNGRDATWKHGQYLRPEERPYFRLSIRPRYGKSGAAWRDFGSDLHGGVGLDLELEPGEQVAYRATLVRPSTHPLQVTPILESVTLFYLTRGPEILSWEELP